jgi:hypothetical protein
MDKKDYQIYSESGIEGIEPKRKWILYVIALFLIGMLIFLIYMAFFSPPMRSDTGLTINDINTSGMSEQRIREIESNLSVQQKLGFPMYVIKEETT